MDYFKNYTSAFNKALLNLLITDSNNNSIPIESCFDKLCNISGQTKEANKKMIFVGNGASASFANHMALDWSKNGATTALSFADSALLSALGNDNGFEDIFASPVTWHGNDGDVLVAISSSGNSSNIINAINVSKSKNMLVITFTGLTPNNLIRQIGDLNFYIPAKTYGIVECAHQLLLHIWLDKFMSVNEWSRNDFQNMNKLNFSL